MTTLYDSVVSVLKINGKDVSASVIGITPRFGRVLTEGTTLGASHERVHPGIALTSIDVEFLFNQDATVGSDTVIGPLLGSKIPVSWEYYPGGEAGSKFSGDCVLEAYQPITKVGSLVNATCTLRGTSRGHD
jgi:hypothetical protein